MIYNQNTNIQINDTLTGNLKDRSFTIYLATPQEINDIINNLAYKNTTGFDELNQKIIIKSAPYISNILSEIINSSFETGIVPDDLKIAKVIPIYKAGDKSKLSNYRPISILPIFSKIIEKAMFNRLIKYMDKFDMLKNSQFGFRPNHSTYMPLINLIDMISTNFDENNFTIGVFLDLTKAFDLIDHKILIKKINLLRIERDSSKMVYKLLK